MPPPNIPVPKPPYSPGEPHPLSSPFPAASIQQAVTASGLCAPSNGAFQVDNGWQITAALQVWSGWFDGSGQPAIVVVSGASAATLYELSIDGAPGPAYVDGVKGAWVLLGQGYGYEVFNPETDVFQRSDANADPLQ